MESVGTMTDRAPVSLHLSLFPQAPPILPCSPAIAAMAWTKLMSWDACRQSSPRSCNDFARTSESRSQTRRAASMQCTTSCMPKITEQRRAAWTIVCVESKTSSCPWSTITTITIGTAGRQIPKRQGCCCCCRVLVFFFLSLSPSPSLTLFCLGL